MGKGSGRGEGDSEQRREPEEWRWQGAGKGATIKRKQLQELERILDGKKASLRNTYRAQTGANVKVWDVNDNTERTMALALRAKSFNKYEDAGQGDASRRSGGGQSCVVIDGTAKMAIEAAKEAEEAALKLRKARERNSNMAKVFDKVDGEVNEALVRLKTALVASTSAASWSCGAGDQAGNERSYLDAALKVLRSTEGCVLSDDGEDVFVEEVVEGVVKGLGEEGEGGGGDGGRCCENSTNLRVEWLSGGVGCFYFELM